MLTADTYTSGLPAAQHKAAEATARLILTAARAQIAAKNRRRHPGMAAAIGPDVRHTIAS